MTRRAAFALTLVWPLQTWAAETDLAQWAAAAFAGAQSGSAESRPALVVQRQDHGTLQRNRSVLGTPLRIGRREFARGLGTHANSEIAVVVPVGAAVFRAFVGVDNNEDTLGELGTVEFSVEIDGKNAFRSGILRGGAEAADVAVPIPDGARQIVLRTDQTADGPSHDHADWAAARIVFKEGSDVWLDEMVPAMPQDFLPTSRPPFSFVYDGRPSDALLETWERTAETKPGTDRIEQLVCWRDPRTGLKLTATVTAFRDFPAVEWLLRFENGGQNDTPILENVQALDLTLGTGAEPVLLDQIAGDDCSERSFMPLERELKAGERAGFAPSGGRPSCGAFPFFNLQAAGHGLITAIGWTGQWAAAIARDQAGGTRVLAGMELTHLGLHPGEAIRTPRILLLAWSGERMDAHNQFRRLLLAHYLPKVGGQPAQPAIGAQSFNMNHTGRRPEWNTEAGQLAAAQIERELGCDTHWLDAAWFDGGFPKGVGNWTVRSEEYPNGLRPIGYTCGQLGLKFLVWWEPERVGCDTRIEQEHPEWVLQTADDDGLFNLGDPEARRWLTELLCQQIDDFGVHTYRNDFNIEPLPFWRKNDPPDRQGITEIRYVEGLYELWDALRARFPGMVPDDCASGGRRIDLEMCRRSLVQTRSDTACTAGRSDWDQSQTYGLSLYLPIHATIGWATGAYDCRSSATAGFLGEWDLLGADFPLAAARASITEISENRQYWYGDYYPLTAWTLSPELWMAYQFHRPDLDRGMVLAFRHGRSPYTGLQVKLHGLRPAQDYVVTFSDEDRNVTSKTMAGAELAALELRIERPRSSLLVRYAPATGPQRR